MQANVSLVMHGRGFIAAAATTTQACLRVVVRLRDPAGERSLRSAAMISSNSGAHGHATTIEIDHAGDSVAVLIEVPRRTAAAVAGPGNKSTAAATISFSIVAEFQ